MDEITFRYTSLSLSWIRLYEHISVCNGRHHEKSAEELQLDNDLDELAKGISNQSKAMDVSEGLCLLSRESDANLI